MSHNIGARMVAQAFFAREVLTIRNDHTQDGKWFYHHSMIAWWGEEGSLLVSLCGYGTATTRLRLNLLCRLANSEFRFAQCGGAQYFGPELISPADVIAVDSPLTTLALRARAELNTTRVSVHA